MFIYHLVIFIFIYHFFPKGEPKQDSLSLIWNTLRLSHWYVSFHFPQENLENGSTWKQGAESVLRNGLRRESLVHVPGYDPKDKNYDNMALEKITHF